MVVIRHPARTIAGGGGGASIFWLSYYPNLVIGWGLGFIYFFQFGLASFNNTLTTRSWRPTKEVIIRRVQANVFAFTLDADPSIGLSDDGVQETITITGTGFIDSGALATVIAAGSDVASVYLRGADTVGSVTMLTFTVEGSGVAT